MLANFVDNFDPFIFRLWDNVGPRWFGFAYVLAFISAYFVVGLLSKGGYCDLPPELVSDFITWTALFVVLLGGRIGYVLFYKPEMLREPLSILRVWEGGMASHGGMIGILALTFYYARRHKLTWTNLGDALVVAAPIGLFFGRCANFINGELYGRATNVSLAMQFPNELIENRALGDGAVAVAQHLQQLVIAPGIVVVVVAKLRPTFPKNAAPSSSAAQTAKDLPSVRGCVTNCEVPRSARDNRARGTPTFSLCTQRSCTPLNPFNAPDKMSAGRTG